MRRVILTTLLLLLLDGGTPVTLTPTSADPLKAEVTVTITGDEIYEGPEVFTARVDNPGERSFGKNKEATGTIIDNDNPPVLSMDAILHFYRNRRCYRLLWEEGETVVFTVTLAPETSTIAPTVEFEVGMNSGDSVEPATSRFVTDIATDFHTGRHSCK